MNDFFAFILHSLGFNWLRVLFAASALLVLGIYVWFMPFIIIALASFALGAYMYFSAYESP